MKRKIIKYSIFSLILIIVLFFSISYFKFKNLQKTQTSTITYHMEMFLKTYKNVHFKYPDSYEDFLNYLQKDKLFENHTGYKVPDLFLNNNKLKIVVDSSESQVYIIYDKNLEIIEDSTSLQNSNYLDFLLGKKVIILKTEYFMICDFGLPSNLAIFSKGELISDKEIEKQIKINVGKYIFRNTDTTKQMKPLDIKGLLYCASRKNNQFDTKIICDSTQGKFDKYNVTDSLNYILNNLDLDEVDKIYLPVKLSVHFKAE